MTDDTNLFCYVHPDRETLLRCNNCERPICTQCAVLTPTGYRCKECIQFPAKNLRDGPKQRPGDRAPSGCSHGLDRQLFLQVSRLLHPFSGTLSSGLVIVEVSRWVTQKRRSVLLTQLITGAALLGSLPLLYRSDVY